MLTSVVDLERLVIFSTLWNHRGHGYYCICPTESLEVAIITALIVDTVIII
jgi:hypothetical protein